MTITQAAVVVGLLMLPASAFTQSTAASSPPKIATAKTSVHATKGVVTFVDATRLVITRSPKSKKETSFVVNQATEGVGSVKVGSTVDVRYRTEAEQKIATAVTVEHSRSQP